MKEVSLEVAPALRSNPIFDDRGTARFAYTDPGRRRILLASGTGGRWQTELIWEDGGADDVLDDEQWEVQVVALVDRRGRPVIVAARHSEEDGWLRVFRLAE
jgi:hypothetical protein